MSRRRPYTPGRLKCPAQASRRPTTQMAARHSPTQARSAHRSEYAAGLASAFQGRRFVRVAPAAQDRGRGLAWSHASIRCRAEIAVSRAVAGEGVPGQRDHRVLRPAAMPAFRRVPARASGGIQCRAPALDRPGRRERGAGSRGRPPLPVRGPALPGARYSPRAAGCPGHHPGRRARAFPGPRRSADTYSRRLGDRYPGGTVPVHSQRPPALLRCCVRGPRTVPGRSPGRTVTVIRQDTPSALQRRQAMGGRPATRNRARPHRTRPQRRHASNADGRGGRPCPARPGSRRPAVRDPP